MTVADSFAYRVNCDHIHLARAQRDQPGKYVASVETSATYHAGMVERPASVGNRLSGSSLSEAARSGSALLENDWKDIVSGAGIAGVISLVTSVGSARVGDTDSESLVRNNVSDVLFG